MSRLSLRSLAPAHHLHVDGGSSCKELPPATPTAYAPSHSQMPAFHRRYPLAPQFGVPAWCTSGNVYQAQTREWSWPVTQLAQLARTT